LKSLGFPPDPSRTVEKELMKVKAFHPTPTEVRNSDGREALDLDLVYDQLLREEAAVDGRDSTEEPAAASSRRRRGGSVTALPARVPAPPTGLPAEQLHTWLEWVQDDLQRLEARLEYLDAARTQLREQERLLSELLEASKPLGRS
jgi:hypothetical protein